MKLLPASAASALGGAVGGVVVVIAITFALADNSRPAPVQQDPGSSLLGNIAYGSR